jgi:hypothetical protein
MKRSLALLSLLLVSFGSSTAKPVRPGYTHNIAVVGAVQPFYGQRMVKDYPHEFRIVFRNDGSGTESNVRIIASVKDSTTEVYYRDTVVVGSWISGETKEVSFKNVIPTQFGLHFFTAKAELSTDENAADDSIQTIAFAGWEFSVIGEKVLLPLDSVPVAEKVGFKAKVRFGSTFTMKNYYNVPVRLQIRRCNNHYLVFQADTIVPSFSSGMSLDQSFPSRQGKYDTRQFTPGCYEIFGIARFPTDANSSDDTVRSIFSIVSNKLAHDITLDSIISPSQDSRYINGELAVTIRLRNSGTKDESNVKVHVTAYNWKGAIFSQETFTVPKMLSGEVQLLTINGHLGLGGTGATSMTFVASIPDEEYEYDDTLRLRYYYGKDFNAGVRDVQPTANSETLAGSTFPIMANLFWLGTHIGGAEIALQTRLYKLPEDSLVESYSSLRHMTLDTPELTDTVGDIMLKPGRYRAEVTIDCPGDSNTKDNFASSVFRVAYNDDVSIDSVLSPQSQYPQSQMIVPIELQVRNTGWRRVGRCDILATIYNVKDSAVFQEVVSAFDFYSDSTRRIKLGDFAVPSTGSYLFKAYLAGIDQDSTNDTVIIPFTIGVPSRVEKSSYEKNFILEQNTPNPFTGETSITYQLPYAGEVSTRVLDAVGRTVISSSKLIDQSGAHTQTIDLKGYAAGIYIFEISVNSPHLGLQTARIKMVLGR